MVWHNRRSMNTLLLILEWFVEIEWNSVDKTLAKARLSRVTLGITGLCVIRLRVWGSRIYRPPEFNSSQWRNQNHLPLHVGEKKYWSVGSLLESKHFFICDSKLTSPCGVKVEGPYLRHFWCHHTLMESKLICDSKLKVEGPYLRHFWCHHTLLESKLICVSKLKVEGPCLSKRIWESWFDFFLFFFLHILTFFSFHYRTQHWRFYSPSFLWHYVYAL